MERIYRSHGPDYFGYEAHMDPFSLSYHNYFAPMTGALPNGRQKGVALTDASVSAMPGTDVNGSTALIKSAAQAIDTVRNNCNHMNMKFLPSALEGPSGTRMLLNLIKTYFDLGGGHIQFNCVSSETLCDALQEPRGPRRRVLLLLHPPVQGCAGRNHQAYGIPKRLIPIPMEGSRQIAGGPFPTVAQG